MQNRAVHADYRPTGCSYWEARAFSVEGRTTSLIALVDH